MTFPRLRALWLMVRGHIVQPDPTERLPGDTHSREVDPRTLPHYVRYKANRDAVNPLWGGVNPRWGRCMEPLSHEWQMAGICAKLGCPTLAADWAVIAVTGTANTVEEEA